MISTRRRFGARPWTLFWISSSPLTVFSKTIDLSMLMPRSPPPLALYVLIGADPRPWGPVHCAAGARLPDSGNEKFQIATKPSARNKCGAVIPFSSVTWALRHAELHRPDPARRIRASAVLRAQAPVLRLQLACAATGSAAGSRLRRCAAGRPRTRTAGRHQGRRGRYRVHRRRHAQPCSRPRIERLLGLRAPALLPPPGAEITLEPIRTSRPGATRELRAAAASRGCRSACRASMTTSSAGSGASTVGARRCAPPRPHTPRAIPMNFNLDLMYGPEQQTLATARRRSYDRDRSGAGTCRTTS